MKNILKSPFFAMVFLLMTNTSQAGFVINTVTDGVAALSKPALEKLLKTVQKHGAKHFCKKAKFSSKKYGIRSFKGIFGKSETLAALGQAVCKDKNTDGYKKSTFYKKMNPKIQKLTSKEALNSVIDSLSGKVKKSASLVVKIACGVISSAGLVTGGTATAVVAVSCAIL